jgi:fermentation-respiration switch protein FrsA (DUF1100 family)
MKKIVLILFGILSVCGLNAQSISGQWNGLLKVQGTQLRLVFHVQKQDSLLSSTLDSPDQGAKGIPVEKTTFKHSQVTFELPKLMIRYQGELKGDRIVGKFTQGGFSTQLTFTRKIQEKEKLIRPQEPSKPYPYYSEEVKFFNAKANIHLAGTLDLPQKQGRFPAVILISGSGPQNRDEELLGHKPFLVLADYLCKKGLAVLRFDDRGTADSEGDFQSATSLDFADDVEAAIEYLRSRKEIDKKHIGLIGHSEGGVIAPLVASRNKHVDFIVLLAGTGIRGAELLIEQEELIGRAYGLSEARLAKNRAMNKAAFDLVLSSENDKKLKTKLLAYYSKNLKDNAESLPKAIPFDKYVEEQVQKITSPWMYFFMRYDPTEALEKVKCPVLALNGSKDMQVPPKVNLEAIATALKKGKNKRFSIVEMPNLNHLFQECESGSPSEYSKIEQTFSPLALREISNWIWNLKPLSRLKIKKQ